MTEVERAVLAALTRVGTWASDRDLRALLVGTDAEGAWGPSLASRLRRLGWVEELRNPTTAVSRGWGVTDAGRTALADGASPPEEVPTSWPQLSVWVWTTHRSHTPQVSLQQPENVAEGVHVSAPSAAVLSAWYRSAKKAHRLLTGSSPAGADTSWPTVNLWVWRNAGDRVLHVSPVTVDRVPRLAVPLPRDLAWADALCRDAAAFAYARTGIPGAASAFAQLVAREREAKKKLREAHTQEARRAEADAAARRGGYPVITSVSVRAIPAGLPTLGRRRR